MAKNVPEKESVDLPPIRKFNPGIYQSDEEIIAQFVVRNHELSIVLEVLHGNIKSSSCQHILVVAPRGRGKTMLLARVAAELRTNNKFSEYLLPVRFMEESQEIFNLADFWLETLFQLARECAKQNPDFSSELKKTHNDLINRWQEREIAYHARAAVLAAADRLGRKLVFMVENLQSLCESVDEDFDWKLREVLQSEPQIMLLASATSRFESLDDVTQPFFELFRILSLERLDTSDCKLLWEIASGNKVSGREIRPLEILTGGSPRLLVIVAGFARHGSLRQLMEELVTLIDEHTEYFRSHLENFANTERRVYLAVIDLWQPSKPSEIAARARMDARKVSTMLGRLVGRGAVIVEGSGKKRLYVSAERLYSIYYKLRRERDEAAVVQNLIHFMAVFYSESELYEISENLIVEATQSKTIREGIERAIAERSQIEDEFYNIKWQTIRQISNQALENYKLMNEQFVEKEIDTALKEKDPKKVIEKVNKVLASQNTGSFSIPEVRIASLLNKKVRGYKEIGNFKAMITTCNEVIKRFSDSDTPDLLGQVAWAMIFKVDALGTLGNFETSLAVCDEVIERFSDTPGLQQQVASAMVDKGNALGGLGDLETAITIYDEVIERFSDTPDLLGQVAWAMIFKVDALGTLGNFETAITVCDEVIERFSDTPDLLGQVASVMIDKGKALAGLGDLETAITVYDEVIERFSDTPDLLGQVAWAMIFKVDALGTLGNFETAIAVCDEVIERFSDTPDLLWNAASAMVRKGTALRILGNFETAITVCDEVIERFSDTPDLQQQVASAMVDKGKALGVLGNFETSLAVCDEVIERFSDTPDLQQQVAYAMVDKGNALGGLGNLETAITVYDEVIERFSDTPDLLGQVAWAMIFKVDALGTLGNFETAITVCDEVIERFSDTPDLLWNAASAMVRKGTALRILGNFEASLTVCDEVIERFSDTPDLQQQVASAMIDKGNALGVLGNFEASLAVCDEVIERFSDTPDLQQQVASAMVDKGKALGGLGDLETAITVYDEVIERFSDTPDLQQQVASAMIDKGNALGDLSDFETAITVYDEVIERFSDTPDLLWQVAWAMIFKVDALGVLGNFETAITVCDEVIERFSDTPDLLWHTASAMVRKGTALRILGNFEASLTVCDEVIERFSDTPGLQQQVASAMVDKGKALGGLGDLETAITVYDEVIERFSDTPDLQWHAASAMINKAELQIKIHRSEDALHTCENFEQKVGAWNSDKNTEFSWRAMRVRALALTVQKKHNDAMDVFRLIYDEFIPDNKLMTLKMLSFVQDMTAIGFPVQDLINILSTNDKRSDALNPLIVALRQYGGESVRAPEEILEVATDILKHIKEKKESMLLETSNI